MQRRSLPSRGAWIEIRKHRYGHETALPSLPSRGAWIEISVLLHKKSRRRRSPHGERGLKLIAEPLITNETGRSPHGERGLKWLGDLDDESGVMSLPSRGAWIEIGAKGDTDTSGAVAPLTGSVD